MSIRWFVAAGICFAAATVAAASGDSEGRMASDLDQGRIEASPSRESVNGKYRVLLRKIHVPQDKEAYGQFTDYGLFRGNSWAGYTDLPPGHWVYVYPNWYIWRDCVKPSPIK